MTHGERVAILYPGDMQARQEATPDNNRLSLIFHALAERGIRAEPAVYNDAFCDEVGRQMMDMDAVLVWINPLQEGQGRSMLDAMLREVAAAGIFVSAHPDIIQKIGTKDVLYHTQHLGWGCDTQLYQSIDQLRQALPVQLASGQARVLKQYRGNGGNGVWKIELARNHTRVQAPSAMTETRVRVRHARKGCQDEELSLGEFFARCEPYFTAGGHMIDQAYQERLPEGMVRCYLVHDQVTGFGHQEVNALVPMTYGAAMDAAPPQPSPRLYHPPTLPEFQKLKMRMEREWVPALQRVLDIGTGNLPILWDCDFLLGPKDKHGEDTFVLCEINVSSVAPFPESAVPYLADAVVARLRVES
ncbi:MAG: Cj0069 family protein [Gammaproteobacteria bacterium]|nr:Cj0069 family protein [Gammaproteobacteria bacterium]